MKQTTMRNMPHIVKMSCGFIYICQFTSSFTTLYLATGKYYPLAHVSSHTSELVDNCAFIKP